MWCEQAIIEWSHQVNSIVACCHSANLCALAAQAFQSQQNGAVTRMWRSCWVQPSHKERAIGAVHSKKKVMLLQSFRWCCAECAVHHKWNVHKNNTHIYVARTSNNRVILSGELYFCLLPQCEALRTCRTGFEIAAISMIHLLLHRNKLIWICNRHVSDKHITQCHLFISMSSPTVVIKFCGLFCSTWM